MGPKHDDAELYLRIAKKFAVDLPDERDRVLALKWLKFLRSSKEMSEKKTKMHVTQLLIICLQRKRLVGPFLDPPDPQKKLLQYGWAYQPADMARLILKSEYEKIGKTPFVIDLSGDLHEYVATQEIPQFGTHFFYAFSPEQLPKWDRLNRAVIPKGLLTVSTTESPDASVLATSIARNVNEKQRARILVPEGEKHRSQFTSISVIDPETGGLHEDFVKEVPSAKAVGAALLEDAVQSGIVDSKDLLIDADMSKQLGVSLRRTPGKKKGPSKGGKLEGPHVETIKVTEDTGSVSKTKKMKNVKSKAQKRRTKNAFDMIEEEEDPAVKKQREQAEKQKEDLARREEILKRMPARLRKRLAATTLPDRLKKYPGRDPRVKTPEIFQKGVKVKYRKKYKPEEFGLDDKEEFFPAAEVFADLEYRAPSPGGRRLVWIYPDMPITGRQVDLPQDVKEKGAIGAPGEIVTTPKGKVSSTQKEMEKSWERSYKKMEERRIAQKRKSRSETRQAASLSKTRKAALEKFEKLKAVQPRRLVFDEMDVAIEPEEVQFEKFVYTEFSDEDKTPSILEDADMDVDDVFGDDEVADAAALQVTPVLDALENAEILLETEMETDDVFGEGETAEPHIVLKEVAVEAERQVAPEDARQSPRDGGIRVGKRVLEIPGQKPFSQTFVEQYGDAVLDENMRPVEPIPDEVLKRFLDEKLKQARKEKTPPRVYGPWAETFRKELQRIERGEEEVDNFPEEDAAQYVFPRGDDSILSEGEMDIGDQFETDKVAVPSPVLAAEAKKATRKYAAIKEQFQAKKTQRIEKASQKRKEVEQDLLEPYIYESLPDDRPTLLDASIMDAGLGQALVEPVATPEKEDPLASYERKLDESLRLLEADYSPGLVERLKIRYDEDFLNRRIQEGEIPDTDESIISDGVLEEDLFDEEQIVTPARVKDLPEPPRPRPKTLSPVKHSHLYLTEPQRKRDIYETLPALYISDESFPSDELLEDDGISTAQSSVDAVYPDGVEADLAADLATDLDDEEVPPLDILEDAEMSTGNLFAEEQLMSPSKMRKVSPTTAAIAKSIRMTVEAHSIINKFRDRQGLSPAKSPTMAFEGLSQYVEARESLLDPLVPGDLQEHFPGLMDEPILEENLQDPLLGQTKKVQRKVDQLAAYEEQIMREIVEDRAAELELNVLADEEMEGDDDFEDAITPPVLKDIPMPRTKSPKPPPKLIHSHLFKLASPIRRSMPSAPEGLPDEMLEDMEEPQLEEADKVQHLHLSDEDMELIKALFDGEIPESVQDGWISFHESESPRLGVDDSGYSDIMARFSRLRTQRAAQVPIEQAPIEQRVGVPQEELRDLGIGPEHESNIDDVFAAEAMKSPTLLGLHKSGKATQELHALKNKYRAMKNLPPIEDQDEATLLNRIMKINEALQNALNVPAEEPAQKQTSPRHDFFDSFEKAFNESLRRKEEEELARDIIDDVEISDLDLEVALPAIIKDIAMPATPSPRRPPPPRMPSPKPPHILTNQSPKRSLPRLFAFSSPVKRYKSDIMEVITTEVLAEQSFPSIDEEILEYQPSPGMEDIPPRSDGAAVSKPPSPQMGKEVNAPPDITDMPMDADRVLSPRRVVISATGSALVRSIQASQDFTKLKNKYRGARGLPPVEERVPIVEVAEFVAASEAMRQLNAPQDQLIVDEVVHHTPPRREDPLAAYERELDNEFYPSPERSLLGAEDMQVEDLFGEDMVSTVPPVRDLPMPFQRQSPIRQSPSPRLPSVSVRMSPTRSPRTPSPHRSPRASPLKRAMTPDLEQETPPEILNQFIDQSPVSPITEFAPRPPRSPVRREYPHIKVTHPTPQPPFPRLRFIPPSPVDPLPRNRVETPPIPQPVIHYSPIRLNFIDDIGSPIIDETSPGRIQFEEVAPNRFVPLRDIDKQRWEKKQREAMASRFGISPEAFAGGLLMAESPPRLMSPSPERKTPPRRYLDAPLADTPIRRISPRDIPLPRQLFPVGRLPTNLSPTERLRMLIAQQPRVEVVPLPSRTGFSPLQFSTVYHPPQEELLEMQEPPADMDEIEPAPVELGDLAYALYIPTEQELREAEEIERRRAERLRSPPGFRKQSPRPPQAFVPDASPIRDIEILPGEEDFRWLGNYMPFEEQVRGQKVTGRAHAAFEARAKAEKKKSRKLPRGPKARPVARAALVAPQVAPPADQAARRSRPPSRQPPRSRSASPPPPAGMAIVRPELRRPLPQGAAPVAVIPAAAKMQVAKKQTSRRPPKLPPRQPPRTRSASPLPPPGTAIIRPGQRRPSPRAVASAVAIPAAGVAQATGKSSSRRPSRPPSRQSSRHRSASPPPPAGTAIIRSGQCRTSPQRAAPVVVAAKPPAPKVQVARKPPSERQSQPASRPPSRVPSGPQVASQVRRPLPQPRGGTAIRPGHPAVQKAPPQQAVHPLPVQLSRPASVRSAPPVQRVRPVLADRAQIPPVPRVRSPPVSRVPPPSAQRPARLLARRVAQLPVQSATQLPVQCPDQLPAQRAPRPRAPRPVPRVALLQTRAPPPPPAQPVPPQRARQARPPRVAIIPPWDRVTRPQPRVPASQPSSQVASRPAIKPLSRPPAQPAQAVQRPPRALSRPPSRPASRPPTRAPSQERPQPSLAKPLNRVPSQLGGPLLQIPRVAIIRAINLATNQMKAQLATSGAPSSPQRLPPVVSSSVRSAQRARISRLVQPREAVAKTQEVEPPPRRSIPGPSGIARLSGLPRGTSAEIQTIKAKTPHGQVLLKKSFISRIPGISASRLTGTINPATREGEIRQQQTEPQPLIDGRTIRQSMTIGKVGALGAVKKQSTIQMQCVDDRGGARIVKTNILQIRKPDGQVKKTESKFTMYAKSKRRSPESPERKKQ